MADFNVSVGVTVNLTGVEKLSELSASMNKISGLASEADRKFEKLGTTMQAAFAGLSLGVFIHEMEKVLDLAGKLQNEVAKLSLSGYSSPEIKVMQAQAMQTATAVPTMTQTDVLMAQRETTSLFGPQAATPELTTALGQLTTAITTFTGESMQSVERSLLRSAEGFGHILTNGQFDQSKIQDFMTSFTKYVIAGGGNYDAETLKHNVLQNSQFFPQQKGTPDQLLLPLAALTERYGDSAGTILNALNTSIYKGTAAQAVMTRSRMESIDMIDPSKIQMRVDQFTGKPVMDFSNALRGFDGNIGHLIAEMKTRFEAKQAANPNFMGGESFETFATKMFGNNVRSGRGIEFFASESGQQSEQKLEERQKREQNSPEALFEQSMQSWSNATKAFNNALENFAGAALSPTVQAVAGVLTTLAEGINHLANAAQQHPVITAALNALFDGLMMFAALKLVGPMLAGISRFAGLFSAGTAVAEGAGAAALGAGEAAAAAEGLSGLAIAAGELASGPVGWVAAALTAAVVAISAFHGALKDAAESEKNKTAIDKANDKIAALKSMEPPKPKADENAPGILSSIGSGIVGAVEGVGSAIGSAATLLTTPPATSPMPLGNPVQDKLFGSAGQPSQLQQLADTASAHQDALSAANNVLQAMQSDQAKGNVSAFTQGPAKEEAAAKATTAQQVYHQPISPMVQHTRNLPVAPITGTPGTPTWGPRGVGGMQPPPSPVLYSPPEPTSAAPFAPPAPASMTPFTPAQPPANEQVTNMGDIHAQNLYVSQIIGGGAGGEGGGGSGSGAGAGTGSSGSGAGISPPSVQGGAGSFLASRFGGGTGVGAGHAVGGMHGGGVGGAIAGKAVNASLTAPMRGLLDTIADKESGGRYNAKNPGSTAYGRYQFINSTWADVSKATGLTERTPENQDKNAAYLAARTYKAMTGRDLNTDLQDPSKAGAINNALNKVWPSLAGGSQQLTSQGDFAKRLAGHISAESATAATNMTPTAMQSVIGHQQSEQAQVLPPPVQHTSNIEVNNHLDGEHIGSVLFNRMFDSNPAATAGTTGFDKKMTPWAAGTSLPA